MAKPPKRSQREQLISTFRRKNPRARTSQRPNTTPANLAKKPGLPASRKFDATATFKRSGSGEPPFKPSLGPRAARKGAYRIPGLGEYGREQNTRQFAQRHPSYWPDGPRRERRKAARSYRGTRPTPGSAYNRSPRYN